MPLLLAGGLGGSLETGRVLDYTGKGDGHRKLCSLYLSLMDRMGVNQKRFGDADERLAGLGDGDLIQARGVGGTPFSSRQATKHGDFLDVAAPREETKMQFSRISLWTRR